MKEKESEFLLDCYQNNIDKIKKLIKTGINLNLQDCEGNTALHIASLCGHYEISKLLLKAGVDIHIKNEYGQTALDYAKIECYTDIVNLLESVEAE